ncbi:MAG: L-erythro-3,5-diaminohexanoate dehydrogenase [Candidatus Izimaplasma sp.]|nr:L-erythro-3,5-diaminohexanoate dehydrogenase [Candidatus Izimaplasma bacterium]
MKLTKFGTSRVIHPRGVLPQAATKIDNTMRIYDNELLIEVDTLNIDSASFSQIKKACQYDISKIKQMIIEIVNESGKMQNPVTGSGGMLIGSVKEVGKSFPNQTLSSGEKIATLVSLSLTPLHIEKITSVNLNNDQVKIEGQAILFESGIYARIPKHLNENVVLAALDVAGAPAQVKKLVKKGDTVAIIGAAGKSGILACKQAMSNVGDTGKVIGIVNEQQQLNLLQELELCDEIILADALDSLGLYDKVEATNPNLCDVVINVVNIDNTEMSSILIAKDEGVVYFFSMATSFTKAALGAEGVGKDVTLIIGNGFTKNHSQITLDLLENSPKIKSLFEKKYI